MKKSMKILLAIAEILGIQLDKEKLELVEATMDDGSIISAPSWEAGQPVTIEVDGEAKALPAGEYVVEGVGIIIVETEGVIAQVKPFEEANAEMKKEPKAEPKAEPKDEPKADVKNAELEAVKAEMAELKAKLEEQKKSTAKKLVLDSAIKPNPEGDGTPKAAGFALAGRGMNDSRQAVLDALYGAGQVRGLQMSTTTNITTTYAGQFAGDYIAAALLTAKTISNGGLTLHTNIALKKVLKKLSVTDIVKDATCDFDPTSTVTLTERLLTPEELQVNLTLCKKDFIQDWEAEKMGYSAYKNLPPSFSEFFISYLLGKVSAWNELKIWRGDSGNAGEFDGFIKLLTADGDVNDVAGAAGGVTSSNVIAEMRKVTAQVPDEVWGQEDLRLYVPTNVLKAYWEALGGDMTTNAGFMTQGSVGEKPLNIDGIELFHAPGMTASYMVAAQTSNLHYGTGLLSDENEVKVIDTSETLGDQNLRFVMRYTAGVNHGVGSDIVLYTPS